METYRTATVEQLQKKAHDLRVELRKLNTAPYGSKRIGKAKQKGYGLIERTRKDLARVLTRLNEITKGPCPKGGLHYPFQNRANQMQCRKCRTLLQKLSGETLA